MSQENLWGGFQSDEDDSLKVKAYDGIVFGLNQKVNITKFEYSTLTGSGGTEGNPAIIIEIKAGDSVTNTRIYNPQTSTKLYHKGKEVLKDAEGWDEALKSAVKTARSVITHYLKGVGRTEAEITTATATVSSFEDLARIASTLMADAINTKKPVDFFMHYQASIKGTAEKTYLEIPADLSFGAFITPHVAPVGEWKEEKSWTVTEDGAEVIKKGLRYVDASGNIHRFDRDETYMKGKRATQQTKGSIPGLPTSNPIAGQNNAEKGEWD